MYIFLQSKILNLVLYNCAEINDSTSKDFDSIVCDEYRVVGLYAIFVDLFSAWYLIASLLGKKAHLSRASFSGSNIQELILQIDFRTPKFIISTAQAQ